MIKCTRTERKFKVDFLENKASNEKFLFCIFDSFFRVESPPFRLYHQLPTTLYKISFRVILKYINFKRDDTLWTSNKNKNQGIKFYNATGNAPYTVSFPKAVNYTYSTKIAVRNAEERRASVPGTKILQRVV